MKVILAGATGFIGQALIENLRADGHEIILLARSPEKVLKKWGAAIQPVFWDGKTLSDWQKFFEGADAVINLCGEPIAGKRWSSAQKKKILSSRVESTRAIVEAIKAAGQKPGVLINTSAVGYYGFPSGDRELTESADRGEGFLAEVAAAWEQEALKAAECGTRVAMARVGIVLEKEGGALEKILPPFLFYAGGPLGSGRQWFPWIHREDVVSMIIFALKDSRVEGPFNACAPEPVRMREFANVLGRVLSRPSWFPVPSLALKLLLGEMSDLLLKGQRAVPQRMKSWGYSFRYPDLEAALKTILRTSEKKSHAIV